MTRSKSSNFRYDIFLSYSSSDKRVVHEIADRLRDAGLRVWLDDWIIQPGDPISARIEEGLEQSAILLFCMSANAFGSEWVTLEAQTAIFRDPQNLERRFIPLLLDDSKIKLIYRGFKYIDWRPMADREGQWKMLLQTCQAKVKESVDEEVNKASNNSSMNFHAHSPDSAPWPHRLILRGHIGTVRCVGWSPDQKHLVSGGADGSVRLWEAKSGRALAVLKGHQWAVLCVGFSSDGLRVASGGCDGVIYLWEASSGRVLARLVSNQKWVLSVAWSIDCRRVVSGGLDGTVRVWDTASGNLLSILNGHNGWVNSVDWSVDSRIVSGGDDGTVRIWEAESGRSLAILGGHNGRVNSVAWRADNQCVVSGGADGTIRLWDLTSKSILATFKGHKGWLKSVRWSGDSQRVMSSGADGKVRLWDAASGRQLSVLAGHQKWFSASWSSDGKHFVSGWADGTVRLWDVESGRELAILDGHNSSVGVVSWSGDGERLVSGGEDGMLRLWDGQNGRQLVVLEGHQGSVWSVGWSPDGSRLVSGGWDGMVRLWDVQSGRQQAVFEGHIGSVRSAAWSSDGTRLITGGEDRTVRLWDAQGLRPLIVLKGHYNSVRSVGWSPDGARLVSGGEDGTVRLWDAQSGHELLVLAGHKGSVSSVGWSPDSLCLVSGGNDGTVRLWDAQSGHALAVLEGHKGSVRSVGWSPDGTCLISGGNDGTTRLWEADSGRLLEVHEGHQEAVTSVGWISGDKGGWSADVTGIVLIWVQNPLQTQDLAGDELSLTYTNAKVLVVGDSGAGKTCLTHRLASGTWQPSESTVGAWCTHWALPQRVATAGEPQREVWLWDFGGQADQRLIHQLFLDRAALVLLLFDASREEVLEGLRDWQTALDRTLSKTPPQLLVAARVDAGFGASRSRLRSFAEGKQLRILETSARDGTGCAELQEAIQSAIPWDQLPRRTSPRLFLWIKAEILALRDQGEALLTYKDLRERLRYRLVQDNTLLDIGLEQKILDDDTLKTVLGLLDGPGVLKQLEYGSWVLLRPEWLGVYGQAVLRTLRQSDSQLGSLPIGDISAGKIVIPEGQQRLDASDEQVLLEELERQLQQRKICLREGSKLVFPSHCGRERPASPALPPRFISFAVTGWLDDIHATLVVSLAETQVFKLQELWRDAAAFRTAASDVPMAIQLRRDNATEGEITLHVGHGVADARCVEFAWFIHCHLEDKADQVTRLRHWNCPRCQCPKGNEKELMRKLVDQGENASVVCDRCEKPFKLLDDLERLFADPIILRRAEVIGEQEQPRRTASRFSKLLLLEVGSRLTIANQKWQEISTEEDNGVDLQVKFTNDEGKETGHYLYLKLNAGSSLLHYEDDGRLMFTIKKPLWLNTWIRQPFPVMLVVGLPAFLQGKEGFGLDLSPAWSGDGPVDSRFFPNVRWMEISSFLQRELAIGRNPEKIRQIEFKSEPLNMASILRWRRKILDGWWE
jgi:small GTP-binding protein